MNSVASRAVLLSAAIVVAGGVALAVIAACNGSDETPRRTGGINTGDAGVASGELDDLPTSTARVGDEMVVTGSKWAASGPVRFYLLTREQSGRPFDQRRVVTLGDVTPEEDGAVSFRFRLADSYQTPSGDDVRIEAGQEWHIWAFQAVDGGSHGTGVGPLTVK